MGTKPVSRSSQFKTIVGVHLIGMLIQSQVTNHDMC